MQGPARQMGDLLPALHDSSPRPNPNMSLMKDPQKFLEIADRFQKLDEFLLMAWSNDIITDRKQWMELNLLACKMEQAERDLL